MAQHNTNNAIIPHIHTTQTRNSPPKSSNELLNILYLNMRSIKLKMNEIKLIMQCSAVKYQILVFVETWLLD